MKLCAAARSDVGRHRSVNEDAYALAPHLGLFLVADGMGGHAAGQLASRLAARGVVEALERLRPQALQPGEALRRSVALANRQIFDTAGSKPELQGMGTTLVALLARGGRIAVAHVGDSRAYLVRAGAARQLTRDHTLVAELVRRCELSPGAAFAHPHRHVLTRALGVRGRVDVDTAELSPQPGDVLVLCSDGLTQHVPPAEIAALAGAGGPLPDACQRLVELANGRGGEDNITVALVRIEHDGERVN